MAFIGETYRNIKFVCVCNTNAKRTKIETMTTTFENHLHLYHTTKSTTITKDVTMLT